MEHSILPKEASHIPHRWKVNELSELDAITVIASDLDKLALVGGIYYRLSQVSPKVWSKVQTTKTSELTNDSGFIDNTYHDPTKSDTAHNHDLAYEPKNSNIQSHISNTLNPHGVTASQTGAYTTAQTDTKISEAIASLVDTAPATLDTLKELSDALGGDENFSTTVLNKIGEVNQKFDDMNEPSGFIRDDINSMGIIELCTDGTTVYSISSSGVLTTRTDGKFATGTAFETVASAREFAIYPNGTDYKIYINGSLNTIAELRKITLNNVSGLQYIYHELDGTLGLSNAFTFEYFEDKPITSLVYGNATTNELVLFADERHGIQMDGATHRYLHFTQGVKYVNGMEIQGLTEHGTTFTAITGGSAYDEDIYITPSLKTTAPFLYLNGTSWDITTLDNKVALLNGGVAQYNKNTSGTYSLDNVTGDDAMIVFFIFTNNKINPYMKLLGQSVYNDVASARSDIGNALKNLILTGFPTPEFLPIGAIIVNASGEVQSLTDGSLYYDLRNAKIGGSGISSTSSTYHEDLLGLQGGTEAEYYHLTLAQYKSITNPTDYIFESKNANIQEHISDATKHFTQSEISITESQISDLRSYALANDVYNKTQTDTQISNAVSAVVDSSPSTLDTLNELAAALGDDPNFATTVTTAIGNRIPKVTMTDNSIVRANGTAGDVQESNAFIVDDGSLGLGTSTPKTNTGKSLHLYSNVNSGDVLSNALLRIESVYRNAVSSLVGADNATNSIAFEGTTVGPVASIASSIANKDLRFRINGTSEKMVLDSTGKLFVGTSQIKDMHLGIGTAISPWFDNAGTIDFYQNGTVMGGSASTIVGHNIYFSDIWRYKADGTAGSLRVGNDGTLRMYSGATGTAGAAATLTETLSLSNAGALTVPSISETVAYGKYYSRGTGTAGITATTNYPLFPAANDTLTLGVGTYKIQMSLYIQVATSTVSSALNINLRGAGTAVGTMLGTARGSITNGGSPVQYFCASSIATNQLVTAASAVAGRVYTVNVEGMLDITTAGTIIPSYQWGATLTSGVVTLSSANNIVIEKISNTQTTNIGWV
jgi:hypothetical protein